MFRYIVAIITVCTITLDCANAQSDLVKRGDYLVNGIMTCGNCHTPKGPTGDIMDKAFSGGLSWDDPPFKVTAANITPDKETGIGNYTDAQLKQVLRKGIKRTGVPVAMVMPSGFYEIMTDCDLDAIIAYLHTLKPIKNEVPAPIYKMPQGHPIPPGADKPFTDDDRQSKERVLSRHDRSLYGMPYPDGPARARFRQQAWRRRFRDARTMGRFDVAKHHLEQGEGLGRLDRRRDQARHYPGHQP
jgi:mono/diheme cytochrome c family protein